VAFTNALNCSFVTQHASMWKGCNVTARTGPSPSAGQPSSSFVPIRNSPPGMGRMPSSEPVRTLPKRDPSFRETGEAAMPGVGSRIGVQQD
jgi:hypothetical protein